MRRTRPKSAHSGTQKTFEDSTSLAETWLPFHPVLLWRTASDSHRLRRVRSPRSDCLAKYFTHAHMGLSCKTSCAVICLPTKTISPGNCYEKPAALARSVARTGNDFRRL